MNKPSVAFWTPYPAPYMVDRFNGVADLGELDFEAWFLRRTMPWRKWDLKESEWRFKFSYLPAHYLRDAWWGVPGIMFKRSIPEVIVQSWSDPIYILAALIGRLRRRKIGMYVEGPPDGWRTKRWFKQLVKKQVFNHADFILCPGEDTKKFVAQFRRDQSSIFCLPHPFGFEHYHRLSSQARSGGRQKLRDELGLKDTTFVYVGGLWPRKGVEYLIRAFAQVRKDFECSLMIVGEGHLKSQLEEIVKASGTPDVTFTGFVQKDRLPVLLAAADVFVFPTLGDTNGYVVEEAMACGLPAISTDAAGEIRVRIKENVTRFVVPKRDSEAIAAKLRMFATGKANAARMGAEATRSVAYKTPEWWAKEFASIVRTVLGSRGSPLNHRGFRRGSGMTGVGRLR